MVSMSDIHGINLSSSNIIISCSDNSFQLMVKEITEHIDVYQICEVDQVSLVYVCYKLDLTNVSISWTNNKLQHE